MQAGDAETVERGQSTSSLQTIGWRVSSGWTTLQLGVSMVESIESSFYSHLDSPQDHIVYTWTPASITTTTKTLAPDGSGMFTTRTQWANATSHHIDQVVSESWGTIAGRLDASSSGSGSSGFAVRTFADGTQQLAQQNSEWSSTSDEVSVGWWDFPGTSQDIYTYRHISTDNSGSVSLAGTTSTHASSSHREEDWTWRQGSRSGSGSVSDSNEETYTQEVYFNGWSDNTEWETGWEFTSLALDAVVNESAGWFADALNLDALTSISMPDINWDGDVIISSGNWATDFLATQIRNAVGDENLIVIGDYVEGTFTAIVNQMGNLYDWAANLTVDDLLAAGADIVSSPQKLLNAVQVGLDVVGLIPVVGELADGANALIYAVRGDFVAAGLSAVSMIPVVGDVAGKGGKLGRAAVKYGDEVAGIVPKFGVLGNYGGKASGGGFLGKFSENAGTSLNIVGKNAPARVRGQWRNVNEGMSARARAYQQQITGRTGQAYVVDGVKFDGVIDGVLIDAKGPGYSSFVKNGRFRDWFRGQDALVEQAKRQLTAANGKPIRWHVAEADAVTAIRNLLADKNIVGIEIIHTPVVP